MVDLTRAGPAGRAMVLIACLGVLGLGGPVAGAGMADADTKPVVIRGQAIYATHCASCHGRYLQGQALWQMNDENKGRRATALDGTGRIWRHSDAELFAKISSSQYGRDPVVTTNMPAFGPRLDRRDIIAVMALIKARLPEGLRVLQAALNPNPPPIGKDDGWRFPPRCGPAARSDRLVVQRDESLGTKAR